MRSALVQSQTWTLANTRPPSDTAVEQTCTNTAQATPSLALTPVDCKTRVMTGASLRCETSTAEGLAATLRKNSGEYRLHSTPPTLPGQNIFTRGEVKVVHYHGSISGEHGPPHAHVLGGGHQTKIGMNGKPLKGFPELTRQQARAVEEGRSAIRAALSKIGRWHRFYNPK